MLPILRTRLALALIAAVVVALELTLMRGLAIRLSSHFAGIVISVGLLGFGAAGSFLTLFRPFILRNQRATLVTLALLLAAAIPATWWLAQNVALNVNYLMWNISTEVELLHDLLGKLQPHVGGITISFSPLGLILVGYFILSRPGLRKKKQASLIILALFGLSFLATLIPAVLWLSKNVPLAIGPFVTNIGAEGLRVFLIELCMLVPFAIAGAFIGVALMDLPQRINGHYASDLLGSGIGGIGVVLAMSYFSPAQLLISSALLSVLGAALLLQWNRWPQLVVAAVAVAGLTILAWFMPWVPTPNPYKPLTLARNYEGIHTIYHSEGPLGQIDVLEGSALHGAPQLSNQAYMAAPLPPHVELYIDGDSPSLIFDRKDLAAWEFIDYRTAALPFFVRDPSAAPPKVCLVDAGGGVDIGLALMHHSADITALQMNPQIIQAMRGPLKDLGGSIYDEPGVHILNQEPRGFFASTADTFDIIEFPPTGGFGAGGSDATQESYAYTVESLRQMFRHLKPGGFLAVTRGISAPPREELRAFDLAVQALRAEKLPPETRLAMIRGMQSCTILIARDALTDPELLRLRKFSRPMGFDSCYFPGIDDKIANPNAGKTPPKYGDFNLVPTPDYTAGPKALLGTDDQRAKFLQEKLFDVSAPTDNKPYFFHMFQWRSYDELHKIYGPVATFLEVSYIMLLVCLVQAVLLALVLILLPLAPGIRTIRKTRGKFVTFAYFLMLGLGFMYLEMGFLQKLVLYLSHPIYAAAVVIASFLIFAGLGSQLSSRWKVSGSPGDRSRVAQAAAGLAVIVSLLFLLGLDSWLGLTQSWPLLVRCLIAALTIAPLAFALGHLFPLGLQRTAASNPGLVPWAWAVNGFASVVAAATAPLLAMVAGFGFVIWLAIGCYMLAGALFGFMPRDETAASAVPTVQEAIP